MRTMSPTACSTAAAKQRQTPVYISAQRRQFHVGYLGGFTRRNASGGAAKWTSQGPATNEPRPATRTFPSPVTPPPASPRSAAAFFAAAAAGASAAAARAASSFSAVSFVSSRTQGQTIIAQAHYMPYDAMTLKNRGYIMWPTTSQALSH